MYNPFSVYTVIPWAIIFNVVPAFLMIVSDLVIGAAFNDTIKGVLSVVLFIVNLVYIIYVIIIHVRLFFTKCSNKQRRHGLQPITFADLFNILFAGPLIWEWLFLAIFYFNNDAYTPLNEPHIFFNVYLKFLAYSIHALNSGTTTLFPILLLSELAQAASILYYQVISVIIFGGLLTYLMEMLDYNTQ